MIDYRGAGFNDLMERNEILSSPSSFSDLNSILEDGSIDTSKIQGQGVRNDKLFFPTRTNNAIVALDGSGDFTNIQMAINYLNNLTGGTVFIRSGTYTLNDNITLYSNISLVGEDNDNTILDFNGKTNNLNCVGTFSNQIFNVSISNLKIINSRSNLYSLYFKYTQRIYIKEIIFDYNIVDTLDGGGDIHFNHCRRVTVTGCDSRGTTISSGSFIYIDQSSEFSILSNRTNNIAIHSVVIIGDVTSSSISILIQNNLFGAGNSYAINVAGTYTQVAIFYNTIKGNPLGGITLYGTDYPQVIGNYITATQNANHYPIVVSTLNGAVIEGNILEGSDGDGIFIYSVDNSIVSGNRVTGCAGYGVNVSDAASDKNIVSSNQLLGNTSGGLQDLGTATEVGHNVTA